VQLTKVQASEGQLAGILVMRTLPVIGYFALCIARSQPSLLSRMLRLATVCKVDVDVSASNFVERYSLQDSYQRNIR